MALQQKIEQVEKMVSKEMELDFRVLTMRMLHGILYLMHREIKDDPVAELGAQRLLKEAEEYIMTWTKKD